MQVCPYKALAIWGWISPDNYRASQQFVWAITASDKQQEFHSCAGFVSYMITVVIGSLIRVLIFLIFISINKLRTTRFWTLPQSQCMALGVCLWTGETVQSHPNIRVVFLFLTYSFYYLFSFSLALFLFILFSGMKLIFNYKHKS